MPTDNLDVIVIGAGPAGIVAALRAARLAARTALVTQDELGGMAANDGPVPVRTLAHAARLMREARQLPRYGINAGDPTLDYRRLLARVREVTGDVREHAALRDELDRAGVTLHEHAGTARFVEPHVIESENGPRLQAANVILCTGGASRQLTLPGFELTCTHSDAWRLESAPDSLLVIGAGATGVQVASIFNAFGSHVTLFEAAPRILMSEDEQVAEAMSSALQGSGVRILEHAGTIERFEPSPAGVRLVHSKNGTQAHLDATLAVVAVGWVANTDGLDLAAAGVQTDPRGYIKVDSQLRTTAPGIYAAGDVTGHLMVVHEAAREAYLAATNATIGRVDALPPRSAHSAASPTPNMPPSGSARRPPAKPVTSSWETRASTPCRARSSTVAPQGSASSSPTARPTRFLAATSWVSGPSSSRRLRPLR